MIHLKILVAFAKDAFGKEDWQEVRVVVDTEQQAELRLDVPFKIPGKGGSLLSYEEFVNENNGIHFVSVEDPLFMRVLLPGKSLVAEGIAVQLKYGDAGKEVFSQDLTARYAKGEKSFCFSYPDGKEVCDVDTFDSRIEDLKKESPFAVTTTGKLELDLNTNYCGGVSRTTSFEKEVWVKECVPHRNESFPFAYPYHEYEFGLNADGSTNFAEFKGIQKGSNALLAAHSCCVGWDIVADKECFVNPVAGCYGGIAGFTSGANEGYVLEKEVQTCSGSRGNVCDGAKKWSLFENKLVCGDGTGSCSKVRTECQGADSFGFVKDDQGKDIGWCHGTMGCSDFCRSEVVELSPVPGGNANAFARDNQFGDLSKWLTCGCSEASLGKRCDEDFNGQFEGVCQKQGGSYVCA